MAQSILSILNEIAATASTKAKEAIIKREQNNTALKATFAAAYDTTVVYHIKKIPAYAPRLHGGAFELSKAINELSALAKREVTGQTGVDFLQSILESVSGDDATVIERIVERDLKCGASDSIASRVWKNLVPEFPYMRCLSQNWEVEDTSGNKFSIKEVVENKLPLVVKSFNFSTNKSEFNKIVGWFDNGHESENWYKITYEEDGVVTESEPVTGNHTMFLADGTEVTVDKLLPSDTLL